MLILRRLLLAALVGLPVAAFGQRAAPAGPTERCRELLRLLPPVTPEATAEATGPDDCRFEHVRLRLVPLVSYEAQSVTEHGIPAQMPALGEKLDMQLVASGVVFVLNAANKQTAFLNRLQQVPFDVSGDLKVDPEQDRAELRKFALDGASMGHVALSGTVVHIKSDPADAALASVRLHFDSRVFFSMFATPLLVSNLPPNDPQAAYDRVKAQVIAELRALLPQTHASAETVDAVVNFAVDFPHPQHILDLSVEADPPVTLAEVENAGDVMGLLHRLTVQATYAGDTH